MDEMFAKFLTFLPKVGFVKVFDFLIAKNCIEILAELGRKCKNQVPSNLILAREFGIKR